METFATPIVIADGISEVAVIGGLFSKDPGTKGSLVFLGMLSYTLVGPITHATKGSGMGGASIGVRLAMPVGGAMIGGLVLCGSQDRGDTCENRALAGMVLGMIGATVLDAAVFAKRTVTVTEDTTIRWAPSVGMRRGGATLDLEGSW